jgi:arylsulfatase A-like enzyme
MEHLDTQIAPLIAEFTARSEKAGRPWIIVFTTDHGEMLGDHGYFRKCEPYEGSANIPLIVAASPDLKFNSGFRSEKPVCLEDLMPTFLELAGVPAPSPLDGVSLVRTLRGETVRLHPVLHFEHANTYGPAQQFHALTDGRYKYIWRPADGSEQFFDLQTDPREEDDLTRDPRPSPLVSEWRVRMIKELSDRPEGFSNGQRLIAGRPYPSVQKRPEK